VKEEECRQQLESQAVETEATILQAMAEKSNLIFGCFIDFVMSCK